MSEIHDPAVAAPLDSGVAERDREVAELFSLHRTSLMHLATLLGADDPEDIVAEAFYQLFRRWRRLRNPDRAVVFLRSVVCNLTRMRLRHLQVARRHLTRDSTNPISTESLVDPALHDDGRTLLDALTQLPARQREALVLRYWLDLRGVEIAAAMGISPGAVKSHISRGMATLTRVLEEKPGSTPPSSRSAGHLGRSQRASTIPARSRHNGWQNSTHVPSPPAHWLEGR
jgi:RNA polymerase sigma factor (sigma-70 family)